MNNCNLYLTKRELEVLHLVAKGHTDREVAGTLVISPRTVNRHLSNIFVKLAVPGRTAAVAFVIRQGIVHWLYCPQYFTAVLVMRCILLGAFFALYSSINLFCSQQYYSKIANYSITRYFSGYRLSSKVPSSLKGELLTPYKIFCQPHKRRTSLRHASKLLK